jgi:hypothetical protein
VTSLSSCRNIPQEDYQNYRKRTETLRLEGQQDSFVEDMGTKVDVLADLQGNWFLHALLNVGITIGLRINLSKADLQADMQANGESSDIPRNLKVKIWLDRQDPKVDPPLLETTTQIDDQGNFVIEAKPLVLDKEVLNASDPVIADVVLKAKIQSKDQFCGDATGSVTSPLQIDLVGSTFYAQRDEDFSLQKMGLPYQCVQVNPDPNQGDAQVDQGSNDLDQGVDMTMEIPKPQTPDLSEFTSNLANLSGSWMVVANINNLKVKLWLTLAYSEYLVDGTKSAILDGMIRRSADLPDAVPIAQFSTLVGQDGRFEIWLPGFTLDKPLPIQGDILLSAVTLMNNEMNGETQAIWCGKGAGAIQKPFVISLENSSFYAHPWVFGEPLPDETINACPIDQP